MFSFTCDKCHRTLTKDKFSIPVLSPPVCKECIKIDTELLQAEREKNSESIFLSNEHWKRFTDYCQRAHISTGDIERKAMFYILSGSPNLVSKGIDRIYDFKENMLKFSPEEMEDYFLKFCFCTSSNALTRLALNLYNSSYKSLSFADTFYSLDDDNKALVMEAIRIRYKIGEEVRL